MTQASILIFFMKKMSIFLLAQKQKIMNNILDFRGQEQMPLGIRNNNPGNIRPSDKYTWEGQVGINKNFVVFSDILHGIRALAIDLLNKYIGGGLHTVEAIITKYAPPIENNTELYIKAVCAFISAYGRNTIHPDTILSLHEKETLIPFIRAIVNHENGQPAFMVVQEPLIEQALKLLPESLKNKIS
jgi:hypothetical protein